MYSYNLYKALTELNEKVEVILYAPISQHIKLSYSIQNSKKLWTSHFFPFQIFKQALIDKPNIAHIQYEVNTFGPLYTNLLFPLMPLLLKITGAKVVVTMHSVLTNIEKDTLPQPFKTVAPSLFRLPLILFYALMGKIADRIIVHSEVFKGSLIGHYNLQEKKVQIIPHGVADVKPEISQAKLDYWRSFLCKKKMILFFGVLSPRKGLEYLIRSFHEIESRYPEYVLVIAGFEPDYYKSYQKSLQTLTNSMNLDHKVLFTGFIEDEDAHTLFSMAEIIVLPYTYSVSASGPLSIAIQHRKPIVATKTDFFNDFLTDGYDALLVSPMDYDGLAQAIEKLLTDNSLKERFSQNIDSEIQKSSWKQVAETTLKTYFQVIKS